MRTVHQAIFDTLETLAADGEIVEPESLPYRTAGVYLIYDETDASISELLYIGQTSCMRNRFRRHREARYPNPKHIYFIPEESESRRLALEAALILFLRPADNRALLLQLAPEFEGPEWIRPARWAEKKLRFSNRKG